jgi:antibiotic biosynthesis monooxygenase (ABM) superfamily enzyme
MPGSNNGALFIMTLLANFAISERFVASVCVSIVLFVLGKALDYFVKPLAQERVRAWRERRQPRDPAPPLKRRIGF